VDAQAFQTAVESWHDFYLAVGSASAALLGLLFVGVSINLSAITAAERVDLRTRANLAFSNLLYLLALSLIVLIPGADAHSMEISIVSVAVIGLLRVVRYVRQLVRGKGRVWRSPATIRRLSWTVAADAVLIYVAAGLASSGDAAYLYFNTFVVFVLLIGAADVAWDLLVVEGDEARRST
jgi:uncharacterized membrane protein